jgi:hypothetical protein
VPDDGAVYEPVDVPTVVFSEKTVVEKDGEIVLYRGAINLPMLLLPTGQEQLQEQANEMIRGYAMELIACPFDLEALKNKAQNNPNAFTAYEQTVLVQTAWVDAGQVSLLFSIEIRGGGFSSIYLTRGFTLTIPALTCDRLFSHLGISEAEGRALYAAAFAEDMRLHPQYYDNPSAPILDSTIDQSCFCLTDNGVMIWMPEDTVSIGASPLLSLTEGDLVRLIGTGRAEHLHPSEQDALQ